MSSLKSSKQIKTYLQCTFMVTIRIKLCIFIFFSILSSLIAEESYKGNNKIFSFSKSKRIIYEIYGDRKKTFYCGCEYKKKGKKKIISNSCSVKYKKNKWGYSRLEWEHVVPAQLFGKRFAGWKGHKKCKTKKGKPYKGRRCASKTSLLFKAMLSDLYNIVPSVGRINRSRLNNTMAIIPGEIRRFGPCDVEIKNKKIEPAPNIRGDVSRIYMYMNRVYSGFGIITGKEKKMFKLWDKEDPVDKWECERAMRIEKLQGNTNPILKKRCN